MKILGPTDFECVKPAGSIDTPLMTGNSKAADLAADTEDVSTVAVAVAAVVGLLVGVAVGIIIARLRRGGGRWYQ